MERVQSWSIFFNRLSVKSLAAKLYIIFFSVLATSAFALSPKDGLSASELYEEADAIVIIEFSTAEYKAGMGASYVICGEVKQTLKGEVEKTICIEDVGDYASECFNRSSPHYFMAFIGKGRAGNYHSIWAHSSVFEIEKYRDRWVVGKCEIRGGRVVELDASFYPDGRIEKFDKPPFKPEPHFDGLTQILEYALNKKTSDQ